MCLNKLSLLLNSVLKGLASDLTFGNAALERLCSVRILHRHCVTAVKTGWDDGTRTSHDAASFSFAARIFPGKRYAKPVGPIGDSSKATYATDAAAIFGLVLHQRVAFANNAMQRAAGMPEMIGERNR